MLETVLSSQNININDVETVDVGFELVKALVSGQLMLLLELTGPMSLL
ncbi:MAG: hypothetical protein Ct9H90mP2_03400 [Dehalococcoidia bacterium]|nr:MAG: hypothetical protein Ct9H90mP2_03400 [Dehalococcoidia bacterium]